MSRRKPSKICQYFTDYEQFISGQKVVEHSEIEMLADGKKKNFVGKTTVIYGHIQGDKSFHAEVSTTDKEHYRFKLYAFYFDDGPCLRFDSKGRSHCNPEIGQGLRGRQVLTPHFHRFFPDKEIEWAYKTSILEGSESTAIVKDYNRGLKHFCQEASLKCNRSDSVPVLRLKQEELPLSNEEDPQNGVSF